MSWVWIDDRNKVIALEQNVCGNGFIRANKSSPPLFDFFVWFKQRWLNIWYLPLICDIWKCFILLTWYSGSYQQENRLKIYFWYPIGSLWNRGLVSQRPDRVSQKYKIVSWGHYVVLSSPWILNCVDFNIVTKCLRQKRKCLFFWILNFLWIYRNIFIIEELKTNWYKIQLVSAKWFHSSECSLHCINVLPTVVFSFHHHISNINSGKKCLLTLAATFGYRTLVTTDKRKGGLQSTYCMFHCLQCSWWTGLFIIDLNHRYWNG